MRVWNIYAPRFLIHGKIYNKSLFLWRYQKKTYFLLFSVFLNKISLKRIFLILYFAVLYSTHSFEIFSLRREKLIMYTSNQICIYIHRYVSQEQHTAKKYLNPRVLFYQQSIRKMFSLLSRQTYKVIGNVPNGRSQPECGPEYHHVLSYSCRASHPQTPVRAHTERGSRE